MQVIIDISFILHCIRKNADFISQLEGRGFRINIPREVLQELRNLHHHVKTSREDKEKIGKILNILDDHKRFKRVSAGQGKMSDWLLKKDGEGHFIATAEPGIKHKIGNKIVIQE